MKEFYSKTAARRIMGLGPIAFDKAIEDGSVVVVGNRVSGASIVEAIGHSIDAPVSSEPDKPPGPTESETQIQEKKNRLELRELDAKLGEWDQRETALIKGERELSQGQRELEEGQTELEAEREEIVAQHESADQHFEDTKKAKVLVGNMIEEAKAKMEQVDQTLVDAKAKAKEIVRQAEEKGRAIRAFSEGNPGLVSEPKPTERGYFFRDKDVEHMVIVWAFRVAIVAAAGTAFWQLLSLIGG